MNIITGVIVIVVILVCVCIPIGKLLMEQMDFEGEKNK